MSAKPTVVVTASVEADCLDVLAGHARIVINDGVDPWPRDRLIEHCREATAVIGFMPDTVDDAFLCACPSLRIVAGALKGYDNFDAAACSRHGVWLTVVPDLLSAPTADLAIGLMLGLSRHMIVGDRLIRGGGYQSWRPILYGKGLQGSHIGILGFGNVGREIARRLTGFGATVTYADDTPVPKETEEALGVQAFGFDQVITQSDFLVLALPLTERTVRVMDRDVLDRVKPGCLLINPARGSLVDEAAVADALSDGRLGGYAADVFACEDLAQDDRPAGIEPRLLADRDRTVFTPHLGSAVTTVRHEIVAEAALNVLDVLQGRAPRGAVNRPAPAQETEI